MMRLVEAMRGSPAFEAIRRRLRGADPTAAAPSSTPMRLVYGRWILDGVHLVREHDRRVWTPGFNPLQESARGGLRWCSTPPPPCELPLLVGAAWAGSESALLVAIRRPQMTTGRRGRQLERAAAAHGLPLLGEDFSAVATRHPLSVFVEPIR